MNRLNILKTTMLCFSLISESLSVGIEDKKLLNENRTPNGPIKKETIQKKEWGPEEDTELLNLIKTEVGIPSFDELAKVRLNINWTKIQAKFPGRSEKQCRDRFRKIIDKSRNWTQKENKLITELVSKYGTNWFLIAKHLPGRNVHEIKIRWIYLKRNYLNKRKAKPSTDPLPIFWETPNSEEIMRKNDGTNKDNIQMPSGFCLRICIFSMPEEQQAEYDEYKKKILETLSGYITQENSDGIVELLNDIMNKLKNYIFYYNTQNDLLANVSRIFRQANVTPQMLQMIFENFAESWPELLAFLLKTTSELDFYELLDLLNSEKISNSQKVLEKVCCTHPYEFVTKMLSPTGQVDLFTEYAHILAMNICNLEGARANELIIKDNYCAFNALISQPSFDFNQANSQGELLLNKLIVNAQLDLLKIIFNRLNAERLQLVDFEKKDAGGRSVLDLYNSVIETLNEGKRIDPSALETISWVAAQPAFKKFLGESDLF